MKVKLTSFFTLALFFAIEANAASVKYMPGEYKVDPDHSRVSFVIKHFVVSEVEGRFNDVKGEFVLAPNFADSTVEATVAINSIDTAVKKRDDDLRSKNFFNVASYPSMTLKSKKFMGSPESFTLIAFLTIKDVTKEVSFSGKYTGSVKDPWGNERVAIQMKGKIMRKDFHIMYDEKVSIGPAVGEEVMIEVRTEGIKIVDKSKM
jgi:polyisoprenoid-binding protein YceI